MAGIHSRLAGSLAYRSQIPGSATSAPGGENGPDIQGQMKKYRLTLAFALTAVIAIALATTTVNWVIGNLAEDNLVRIAEENTARDGVHIQSMMAVGSQHSMPGMAATGGQRSMDGTASAGAAEGDNTMEDMQRPRFPT